MGSVARAALLSENYLDTTEDLKVTRHLTTRLP